MNAETKTFTPKNKKIVAAQFLGDWKVMPAWAHEYIIEPKTRAETSIFIVSNTGLAQCWLFDFVAADKDENVFVMRRDVMDILFTEEDEGNGKTR